MNKMKSLSTIMGFLLLFGCKEEKSQLLTHEQRKKHKWAHLTQIQSGIDFLKMQEIVLSNQKSIHRIKVPQGWLVTYNENITFMPDPNHEWLKDFSYDDWYHFHIEK